VADKTILGKSEVLKKEMRNEHFKIGNFENDYRPMSVSSFRDVKGKPA